MSERSNNLWAKLIGCANAIGYILREDKKVNNQYYPVSYNAVVEKCGPVLRENGICTFSEVKDYSVRPQIKRNDLGNEFTAGWFCDVHMSMKVVNADNPSEHEIVSVYTTAWDTLDKAADKAITKAQRQCLQKLFMLATYDEDDAPGEGSRPAPAAPPKAAYTTISEPQVAELQALALAINVPEEVVAKAADSSFTKLKEIPLAKFEEVKSRMQKRLAQLKGAPKNENA